MASDSKAEITFPSSKENSDYLFPFRCLNGGIFTYSNVKHKFIDAQGWKRQLEKRPSNYFKG